MHQNRLPWAQSESHWKSRLQQKASGDALDDGKTGTCNVVFDLLRPRYSAVNWVGGCKCNLEQATRHALQALWLFDACLGWAAISATHCSSSNVTNRLLLIEASHLLVCRPLFSLATLMFGAGGGGLPHLIQPLHMCVQQGWAASISLALFTNLTLAADLTGGPAIATSSALA